MSLSIEQIERTRKTVDLVDALLRDIIGRINQCGADDVRTMFYYGLGGLSMRISALYRGELFNAEVCLSEDNAAFAIDRMLDRIRWAIEEKEEQTGAPHV